MYYRFSYILAIALVFIGCKKPQHSEPPSADIQWSKIIIKGEGSITAIYGNIDEQMIVGTNLNIVRTIDSGRTWIAVARNVDQIRKFTTSGDSLMAIADAGDGNDYYSLDNGASWQILDYDRASDDNKNQVLTSKGHIYKFELHYDGELGLPSDVLMSSDNGLSWKNVFPYKHGINRIYVDKLDKIYIGTSDATWNGISFVSKNPEDAVLYFTKGK